MVNKSAQLKLREVTSPYRIIIPKEVKEKIDKTCIQCWNLEWSGTLFYTVEGTVEENNLVCTVQDFYIQDKGSAGFTEYQQTPDVVTYMMDKQLLHCQRGLIHSHNNMSTFFSGTDTSTLQSEGAEHIHFLSLIVNNAGTYTAGITTKITTKKTVEVSIVTTTKEIGTVSYETWSGTKIIERKEDDKPVIESETEKKDIDETVIEWSRLSIEVEGGERPADPVMEEIKQRFAAIETAKRASSSNSGYLNSIGYHGGGSTTFFPKENQGRNTREEGEFDWRKWENKSGEDVLPKKTTRTVNATGVIFGDLEEGDQYDGNNNIRYKDIILNYTKIENLAKLLVMCSTEFEKQPYMYGLSNMIRTMTDSFSDVTPQEYEDAIGRVVDYLIPRYDDDKINSIGAIDRNSIVAFKIKELLSRYQINPYLERLIKAVDEFILPDETNVNLLLN